MLFEKAAILGIGLIGSSLARCLKQNSDVKTLAVYDKNSANLQKARELDLADIYAGNLCEAVKGADLVVFATPVCAFGALARESAPFLKKGTVITDVGSVKQYSLREMEKYLNRHNGMVVVGGHPVAGTENPDPKTVLPRCLKGVGAF